MSRGTFKTQGRTSLTLASLLISLFSFAAWSQQNTAKVTGTITDPSGSPVPGAAVTLENLSRGVARSATSDTNGSFYFDFVPVGEYRLTVSQTGFSNMVRSGLDLSTGQILDLPLKLELQQINQTVEVQSEVAALDTTSA